LQNNSTVQTRTTVNFGCQYSLSGFSSTLLFSQLKTEDQTKFGPQSRLVVNLSSHFPRDKDTLKSKR